VIKEYTIELKDQVSPGAKSAADSVRGLESSMRGLESSANKMTSAMGDAGGGASGFKEKSEGMFGAFLEAEIAVEAIKALGEAVLSAAEFVGELAWKAIEASEKVNMLTASFQALAGGGQGAGEQTLAAVRKIAKEIPQSETVVQKWAQSLMAAGVTDMSQLQGSLKAIAGAEALVEGGGDKVKGMLAGLAEQGAGSKLRFNMRQLAGTGLTESDFLSAIGMTAANFNAAKKKGTITGQQIGIAISKALEEKSAGALDASMNTWDAAVAKGKDLITHLFEGVDTEGLMASVRDFFSVFDLANPSGQAIKVGIGGAMKWITEKMQQGILLAKHLFLFLELHALLTYNYLRPIVHSFLEWSARTKFLSTVLDGLEFVLMGIGAAIGVAIVAVAAIGVALAGVATGVAWLIGKIPDAIAALIGLGARGWDALKEFVSSGARAAVDFVAGMIKGIVDGTGALVAAASHMAKSAWNAVTGALGIHSPSTVMMKVGANFGEGTALGIESKDSRVASAAGSQSAAAIPAAAASKGGGSSSSSVSNKHDWHITINAKDGATAKDLYAIFEEQLASIEERLALSQGVAPMASAVP
jgi:hypothetical protein